MTLVKLINIKLQRVGVVDALRFKWNGLAGLLEALHNETPMSETASSLRERSDAGYEPPSEAALLADGLIEPVNAC